MEFLSYQNFSFFLAMSLCEVDISSLASLANTENRVNSGLNGPPTHHTDAQIYAKQPMLSLCLDHFSTLG